MINVDEMRCDAYEYMNDHFEFIDLSPEKEDRAFGTSLSIIKLEEASIQYAIEKQLGGSWWDHTELNPFELLFFEGRKVNEVINLIARDINARMLISIPVSIS